MCEATNRIRRKIVRIDHDLTLPDRRIQAVLFALLLGWAGMGVAGQVDIQIGDDSRYHVHSPGKPFSVQVEVANAGPGKISYHWQDFQGEPLSSPAPIGTGSPQMIESPARSVGYYGLVFETTDPNIVLPNRRAGEAREYGFAVLPQRPAARQASLNTDSPFGVVHADPEDPYLAGWVKTSTWKSGRSDHDPYAADAAKWRARIGARRNLGLVELPIILGDPWNSDDSRPISARHLSRIESLAKQYFQADRKVLFWEVGIEENLSASYKHKFYWPNLEAKIKAVRQAANEANPKIKLIYQIAGRNTEYVQNFLNSNAASVYDILAPHPYAWPDFPSPEEWLASYVDAVRQYMRMNSIADMPIWFTEVGAPHQGNDPGGFFGYPRKGLEVEGLSRQGEPVYMIKLHVLALAKGVEKIFWYNYQDRGDRREYAEDHFGMRDYWGFPKPVYAAYHNLRTRLENKSPADTKRLLGNVWVSEFNGVNEDVLVAWVYRQAGKRDSGREQLAWSSLREGLSGDQVAEIVNTMGTPIPVAADGLTVTGRPLFVVVRNDG